jgi:hypothetical protein
MSAINEHLSTMTCRNGVISEISSVSWIKLLFLLTHVAGPEIIQWIEQSTASEVTSLFSEPTSLQVFFQL